MDDRLEQIEKEVIQIKLMLTKFLSNQNSSQSISESLLNVKDVSAFLKIDSSLIYTACNKGEIPFLKIGKSYKFKKEDILDWVENGKNKNMIDVDEYVNNYLQKHTLRG